MWIAAFTFARKNWQAIAIAVIVGVVWFRISSIVSERDEAMANLKTTTDLIRDNALKAVAENELLAKQGAAQRKADQEQGIKNAQLIGNAYYEMFKDAKNEKIDSDRTANNLRDQLREQSAIIASRGRAEDDALHAAGGNGDSTIPGRVDEESAEFYKTAFIGAIRDLKICKLSGASCASDFNECRAYVLGEQSRIGIEKSRE